MRLMRRWRGCESGWQRLPRSDAAQPTRASARRVRVQQVSSNHETRPVCMRTLRREHTLPLLPRRSPVPDRDNGREAMIDLPEVPEPNAPLSPGELAFRALQHTREYKREASDMRIA